MTVGIVKSGFTQEERQELIQEAMNLRALRLSQAEIARRLGVSQETIFRWIRESVQKQIKQDEMTVQEVTRLEMETLDHMQAVLAPNVEEGQLGAIALALKISESRRKLLGIDKPDSHELNVSIREIVGVNPDDI